MDADAEAGADPAAAAATSSSSIPAYDPNDKPRLTEQEKKNNHIASEQKRRQAIREGFDEIADIVPGMKGHGRSEAMVLESATAYVKKLLADRHRLIIEAQSKGIDASEWILDDKTMGFAKDALEEEELERDINWNG